MEKDKLKKLASLGLLGGLMLSAGPLEADYGTPDGSYYEPSGTYRGSQTMTPGYGGMEHTPQGYPAGGGCQHTTGYRPGSPQESRSGQYDGGQYSGGQYSGGQYSGGQYSGSQSGGTQYGDQYGGQYGGSQSGGRQYKGGQYGGQGSYHGCGGQSGCHGASPQAYRNIPYYTPPSSTADTEQDSSMQTESYARDGREMGRESMAEKELMNKLNPEAKALYQTLTPEGKALAQKLAQETQDKNMAVKAAVKRMAEKKRNAPQ